MSRTNWKQIERDAAALCRGIRYPANMGGRIDVLSAHFVAQVKNPKVMSLAALEALAEEMEAAGHQQERFGVVIVKRSAGSGVKTPMLVVMTGDVFGRLVASV